MPSVARTLSTAKTASNQGNASNSRKRQQTLSRDSRTELAWNPATVGTPKTTAEALFMPARIATLETAEDTNNSRDARNSREASNSGDTTSMMGARNHRVACNR